MVHSEDNLDSNRAKVGTKYLKSLIRPIIWDQRVWTSAIREAINYCNSLMAAGM